MLIGLLSDTHIPDHVKELPSQLREVFHGVDLILHAGDVYYISVLDELESLAPVLVAHGDDDAEILKDRRAKAKHVLTVEGVTIWLVHEKPWLEPQDEQPPDVVVFGHLHRAFSETLDGVLWVTPGSATFNQYIPAPGTVGLLTVNSGKADAQIIQLQ